jgi:hypothetical protein
MTDDLVKRLRDAAKGLRSFYDVGAVELIPAGTMEDAAAHIEALQAQLAERDRALAEWAEASQLSYQRANAAEDRLAEAWAGLEKIADRADYRLPKSQDIARATLAKIGWR